MILMHLVLTSLGFGQDSALKDALLLYYFRINGKNSVTYYLNGPNVKFDFFILKSHMCIWANILYWFQMSHEFLNGHLNKSDCYIFLLVYIC